MFRFNLTKKLFWFIASFIIFTNLLGTLYLYNQTQKLIQERALEKAILLQTYFVSMRYIYHQQFLKSGLELSDATLGFLPAHASALISDLFSQKSSDGSTIRSVSDRPRNIANKADAFEEETIRYFIEHPESSFRAQIISQKEANSIQSKQYFFYASPLRTEDYCLSCHGEKAEVLPFISKRYDSAYDYKVGDVRGITSIKVPMNKIAADSMNIFYKNTVFSWVLTLFLLLFVYYVVRKLTIKEAESKQELQKEVSKKTASLEAANEKQKHLFSILRTVTDCNQVLITSSSLDELISQTSYIIYANGAFDGVKILLKKEEHLEVASSLGLSEEFNVMPLEAEVFEKNRELILDSFDASLPPECLDKVKRYAIEALYFVPLIHDTTSEKPLGVLAICTKTLGGFSDEEKAMIRELAGDIGFAVNSYMQKEQIQRLAHYNTLTALPNRSLLLNNLQKQFETLKESANYIALLYIDIDNFKAINDFKGVMAGDTLLQEISARFVATLSFHDEIYHLGGDEFVLLLNTLSNRLSKSTLTAQNRAQKLLDTLDEPFIIESQSIYVTLSIGITLFKDTSVETKELINNAESAMKLSKKAGKNTIRFYDDMSQKLAIERSSMIQDMRLALEEEQFFMLYQKQLTDEENVIGVEALVRWRHPTKGIISPAVFIPLAEESGLIVELGAWIFKASVAQIALWSTHSEKKQWQVSINVSPLQFNDPAFVNIVNKIVTDAKVAHQLIRLELTEGILITDIHQVNLKIVALKKLGFSISIDDFGTGYSSLSYLKALPIDELKIDQSFVKNLASQSTDRTIVKTILAMGDAFELEVIAEGVETQEQYNLLRSLGCSRFQGYLFARPKEASEL